MAYDTASKNLKEQAPVAKGIDVSEVDNHTQLSLADIDRLRAAIDRVGIKPLMIDGQPMMYIKPFITRQEARRIGLRPGEYIPAALALPRLQPEVSMSGKITIHGNGWIAQYELQKVEWPYCPAATGESLTVTLGNCLERVGGQDFELRDEIAKLREQYASLLKTCESAIDGEKRQREQMEMIQRMLFAANAEGPDVFARLKCVLECAESNKKERDRFVRQQSESNALIGKLRSECVDAENRAKAADVMRNNTEALRVDACKQRDHAQREAFALRGLLKHTEEGNAALKRDNERLQGELKAVRDAADALQRRCDDQKAEFETACALFDAANGSTGLAKQVLEGVKSPSLQVSLLQSVIETERGRIREMEKRISQLNDSGRLWMGVDMGAAGADTTSVAELRNGKVESVRVLAPQLSTIPQDIHPSNDMLRDQLNYVIEAHNALARRCHGS